MSTKINKPVIYRIKDYEVLFDFQIAELLNMELSDLRRAIRKYRDRFPYDFMLEVTKQEWDDLQCPYPGLPDIGKGKIPYALTAGGICMLCACLPNNLKANEITVQVIRTYVKLRKYQPAFIGMDKMLRKHERNCNLNLFDIYNAMVEMAV